MRRLSGICLIVVTALWLAGCGGTSLVVPYDQRVESTVSEFDEAFREFVAKRQREARTAAGEFSRHTDFYDKWSAKLGALRNYAVARAPTASCKGSETFSGVLARGISAIETEAAASHVNAASDSGAGEVGREEAPQGSCTARLLRLLELQFKDFEAFHKAQGSIGLDPRQRAPGELMDVVIRAVLQVEIAKREAALF